MKITPKTVGGILGATLLVSGIIGWQQPEFIGLGAKEGGSFAPASNPANISGTPNPATTPEVETTSASSSPASSGVVENKTVEALEARLVSLKAELVRLEKDLPSETPKAAPPKTPEVPIVDPEQNQILRQAALSEKIQDARKRYKDFFAENSLTSDEMKQLVEMIGEHELEMEMLWKAANGGSYRLEYAKYPRMDQKEANAREMAQRETLTKNMKAFLGPQRFQQYEDYNGTFFPRLRLNEIERELQKFGAPLDPNLRASFIGTIKEKHTVMEAKLAPLPKGREKWERFKEEANVLDMELRNHVKTMLNAEQRTVMDGMEFKRRYE